MSGFRISDAEMRRALMDLAAACEQVEAHPESEGARARLAQAHQSARAIGDELRDELRAAMREANRQRLEAH